MRGCKMPNWCENSVRVHGDPKEVKEFVEFVKSKEQEFDFEKVVPLPNGEGDNQWCVDNWGTKWNACDISVDIEDKEVAEYFFMTAWSPPEEIYWKLKEKFKIDTEESSLYVSWFYNEPNMEICGYLQNENGG
jgi:hypothetical protein